jgi:hypothetical protein
MFEILEGPFQIGLALVLLGVIVFVVSLVWPVVSIDSYRRDQAKELSGSASGVLFGEVETNRDGVPDPRVAKGIAWDIEKKAFVPQGKISDEYLNSLLG